MIFSKICLKSGDFPKHHRDCLVVSFATFQTRVTRFGPKVGQTDPNGTNLELFSANSSVHFGSVSENVLNLILKGPRFVPFRVIVNLLNSKICPVGLSHDYSSLSSTFYSLVWTFFIVFNQGHYSDVIKVNDLKNG